MSLEPDPWRVPESSLDRGAPEDELAGRGTRLAAQIVDTLLAMVFLLPLMFWFGVFDGHPDVRPPSALDQLSLSVFSFAVFLALHGYLLMTRGQTIGKWLLGIRITRPDGALASLGRLVGLRYLPLWVVAYVPIAGQVFALADALFIFTKSRRCLHDHIAGTIVVRVA